MWELSLLIKIGTGIVVAIIFTYAYFKWTAEAGPEEPKSEPEMQYIDENLVAGAAKAIVKGALFFLTKGIIK